jgi:hypothetical protein
VLTTVERLNIHVVGGDHYGPTPLLLLLLPCATLARVLSSRVRGGLKGQLFLLLPYIRHDFAKLDLTPTGPAFHF